ncbi:histidine phosphatase family protein [Alkalicoccobacillus porphyridii]|uniref:Histidine phosphatase family protein n=1 Tax=Alkalicoccobacillus porphyridii TaxID=2597270 RepID=A0A554A266_9BACI|nr:histidine phosphatase family protein [Alkalicoccobacillus porphyridii]TSB47780.1 histidine phosphatase family protein [Alkalicoccobacillus porphyridii]
MAIYLVRHGRDDEGYRGGWSQRGLIEEGKQQAKKLAAFLKREEHTFKVNRVMSSDLARALETAEKIGRELNVDVVETDHWRETNNGVLAGMPNEEADQKYPGLYYNSLEMDERFPGGESPNENFTRIKEAFEMECRGQIESNHQDDVFIVTHGGVINIIYHILKDKTWSNKNKKFPINYTSLHKIEYVKGKWVLTMENMTEHLE